MQLITKHVLYCHVSRTGEPIYLLVGWNLVDVSWLQWLRLTKKMKLKNGARLKSSSLAFKKMDGLNVEN